MNTRLFPGDTQAIIRFLCACVVFGSSVRCFVVVVGSWFGIIVTVAVAFFFFTMYFVCLRPFFNWHFVD